MWRWLSVPFALASAVAFSAGALAANSPSKAKKPQSVRKDPPIPPSSVGTTSPEEAEILWNDGRNAFHSGEYSRAAQLLQRLVDRYPAYPGYLAAHLLLGKTRMELHDPKRAVAPLKYYVAATGKSAEGVTGRLELGEAYLALKLPNEALLTALEAEKLTSTSELGEKHADSLLLKARALMALNRDLRASTALQAAKKLLSDPRMELPTRANAARLEQNLKLKACARFPSSGIDEGQLRQQLEQRGQCLNEAVLLFRKVLEVGHERTAELAASDMSEALIAYHQASYKPRTPTGKRTPEELARFRAELRTILLADARSKLAGAADIMTTWKEILPEPMLSHARFVEKTIQRLTKS